MNLYELTTQRLALQNKLQLLNLDEETIADTLDGESTEIEKKIEDYGYVIRSRTAFADAMSSEIARMIARRDAELKRIEGIESWLLSSMIACNITKIECPAFSVSVRTNPPSVDVISEADIPAEYIRTPEPEPPVPAPDKKAILAALKSGVDIPGCAIKRSQKLEIK